LAFPLEGVLGSLSNNVPCFIEYFREEQGIGYVE